MENLCTYCNKEVEKLETFSKGECLPCHEYHYIENNQIPTFIASINRDALRFNTLGQARG